MKITSENVQRVFEGEEFLVGLGFEQVRVRVHGDLARIEVEEDHLLKAIQLHDKINDYMKKIGFTYVALDLAGYKYGRMNDALDEKQKKNYGRLSNEGSDKVLVRRVEARGLVQKSEALDQEMRERFEELYWKASRGELFHWRATAEGRLAEILLLDQIPRNIFSRDCPSFCDRFPGLGLGPRRPNTSSRITSCTKRLFLHALYAFGIFNHS